MDILQEYGFETIDLQMYNEIFENNKQLKPLLLKYRGMGWYQLLVENNKLETDKRYLFVNVGGENGYTVADNFVTYSKINESSAYYTIHQIIDECKKNIWSL